MAVDGRRGRKQVYSDKVVELKRAFRTYLEIVNGLWAPQEGIEEALDDLEAAVRESYSPNSPLFFSDGEDGHKENEPRPKQATNELSMTIAELNAPDVTSGEVAGSNVSSNTSSTFGKPTLSSLPASILSESAKVEGTNISNSSTDTPALQEEQSRFNQPFVSSPTPSKPKKKFSAPPGKWTFPEGVVKEASAKLAAAYSSIKGTNLKPPVASEKTVTQASPFGPPSPIESPRPNPFSQTSSENANTQASPFGPSTSSEPSRPNPFSQIPSDNTKTHASPFGPSTSSEPLRPNPFSQISSETLPPQPLSSVNPGLPNIPAPSPFSQILPQNMSAQPSTRTVSNPFIPAQQEQAHQTWSKNTNAQPVSNSNSLQAASLPSWDTQNSTAAPPTASWNGQPTFSVVSPFSGSFYGVHLYNPAGIASLPTLEMLRRSTIPVMPLDSYPVSLACSPFSGSFNGVQFSQTHMTAVAPSMTTHLATQNTPAVPILKVQPPTPTAPSAPSTSEAFKFPEPSSDQIVAAAPMSAPKSSAVSPQGVPSSSTPATTSPIDPSRSTTTPMGNSPFSFLGASVKLSHWRL